MQKSYSEINAKIKSGKAVVLTADDFISLVNDEGISKASQKVDVVTTGTFAPMCSSGAFLNFGHSSPRIRMQKVWLNGVPAYAGIAAVDAYIGATETHRDDPLNSNFPGEFKYGGGHIIEELVSGKHIQLEAASYGTDCYPRKEINTTVTLDGINEALLFNPRNAYQNYNCAINTSDRNIYTYMGMLKPRMGNAHYSTSGQLSPLMKDPYFKTIGLGTRIFLGGGIGYVAWNGTQHFPSIMKSKDGKELGPAGGTLTVMGDLKQMSADWLKGVSFTGYGCSLAVGIGIPIPILNEEIAKYAAVSDQDLYAPIVDYSNDYPNKSSTTFGYASYAELKSGKININGKDIPTAPLSSYTKAKKVASILKEWIDNGKFLLNEPVQKLPSPDDNLSGKTLNS